jgi:3-oxoacyl-[acyl-carrier-protein] synthase II
MLITSMHMQFTPLGDRIKASTIDRIVRDYPRHDTHLQATPLLISTKGVTGHLLGATAAWRQPFSFLSIHDREVPPTRNLKDESDCMNDIDSFQLATTMIKTPVNVAMSNSFGFGGTNASLLILNGRATTLDTNNNTTCYWCTDELI